MIGDVKAGDFVDVFATILTNAEGQGPNTDAATAAGTPGAAGANKGGAVHLVTGGGRIFTRRLLTKVRVLEVPEDQ